MRRGGTRGAVREGVSRHPHGAEAARRDVSVLGRERGRAERQSHHRAALERTLGRFDAHHPGFFEVFVHQTGSRVSMRALPHAEFERGDADVARGHLALHERRGDARAANRGGGAEGARRRRLDEMVARHLGDAHARRRSRGGLQRANGGFRLIDERHVRGDEFAAAMANRHRREPREARGYLARHPRPPVAHALSRVLSVRQGDVLRGVHTGRKDLSLGDGHGVFRAERLGRDDARGHRLEAEATRRLAARRRVAVGFNLDKHATRRGNARGFHPDGDEIASVPEDCLAERANVVDGGGQSGETHSSRGRAAFHRARAGGGEPPADDDGPERARERAASLSRAVDVRDDERPPPFGTVGRGRARHPRRRDVFEPGRERDGGFEDAAGNLGEERGDAVLVRGRLERRDGGRDDAKRRGCGRRTDGDGDSFVDDVSPREVYDAAAVGGDPRGRDAEKRRRGDDKDGRGVPARRLRRVRVPRRGKRDDPERERADGERRRDASHDGGAEAPRRRRDAIRFAIRSTRSYARLVEPLQRAGDDVGAEDAREGVFARGDARARGDVGANLRTPGGDHDDVRVNGDEKRIRSVLEPEAEDARRLGDEVGAVDGEPHGRRRADVRVGGGNDALVPAQGRPRGDANGADVARGRRAARGRAGRRSNGDDDDDAAGGGTASRGHRHRPDVLGYGVDERGRVRRGNVVGDAQTERRETGRELGRLARRERRGDNPRGRRGGGAEPTRVDGVKVFADDARESAAGGGALGGRREVEKRRLSELESLAGTRAARAHRQSHPPGGVRRRGASNRGVSRAQSRAAHLRRPPRRSLRRRAGFRRRGRDVGVHAKIEKRARQSSQSARRRARTVGGLVRARGNVLRGGKVRARLGGANLPRVDERRGGRLETKLAKRGNVLILRRRALDHGDVDPRTAEGERRGRIRRHHLRRGGVRGKAQTVDGGGRRRSVGGERDERHAGGARGRHRLRAARARSRGEGPDGAKLRGGATQGRSRGPRFRARQGQEKHPAPLGGPRRRTKRHRDGRLGVLERRRGVPSHRAARAHLERHRALFVCGGLAHHQHGRQHARRLRIVRAEVAQQSVRLEGDELVPRDANERAAAHPADGRRRRESHRGRLVVEPRAELFSVHDAVLRAVGDADAHEPRRRGGKRAHDDARGDGVGGDEPRAHATIRLLALFEIRARDGDEGTAAADAVLREQRVHHRGRAVVESHGVRRHVVAVVRHGERHSLGDVAGHHAERLAVVERHRRHRTDGAELTAEVGLLVEVVASDGDRGASRGRRADGVDAAEIGAVPEVKRDFRTRLVLAVERNFHGDVSLLREGDRLARHESAADEMTLLVPGGAHRAKRGHLVGHLAELGATDEVLTVDEDDVAAARRRKVGLQKRHLHDRMVVELEPESRHLRPRDQLVRDETRGIRRSDAYEPELADEDTRRLRRLELTRGVHLVEVRALDHGDGAAGDGSGDSEHVQHERVPVDQTERLERGQSTLAALEILTSGFVLDGHVLVGVIVRVDGHLQRVDALEGHIPETRLARGSLTDDALIRVEGCGDVTDGSKLAREGVHVPEVFPGDGDGETAGALRLVRGKARDDGLRVVRVQPRGEAVGNDVPIVSLALAHLQQHIADESSRRHDASRQHAGHDVHRLLHGSEVRAMSARDEPVAEEIQHGPAHGGARSRQMMCHSERREKLNLQRDFRQRRAERDGEAVRSHPVREGGVDHRNLRRARRSPGRGASNGRRGRRRRLRDHPVHQARQRARGQRV